MAIKRYKTGELNSLNVDERTGIELDPNRFDPLEKLYHSVKKAITLNHFEESGKQVARCISVNEGKLGWLANAYDPGDDIPDTEIYTVTAALLEGTDVIYPEIDNPDGTFRPENLFYEDYVSISSDVRKPIPGELIYVEFGNYKSRSTPFYVGPVRPTINNIGTLFRLGASSFFSDVGAAFGLKGPAGDGVGANNPNAGGQNPTAIARSLPAIPEPIRPGFEPAFGRGEYIGQIEMGIWTNPDDKKTKRKIAKDSIQNITNLDNALFEKFGLKIFINSGFRTDSEQIILYDRYLKGKGNKAAPPRFSNHQRGRAIDISIWNPKTKSRSRLKRSVDPTVWDWFQLNAGKYSLSWEEGSRIGEPWHWNYVGPINGLNE